MDRVIGMMVRYEPSDRISAEELVRLIPGGLALAG